MIPSEAVAGADHDATLEALLEAIEESLGRADVDTALGLVRSLRRRVSPTRVVATPGCHLTDRELTTLALLPDATLSQKDMAQVLGISHNTVKTHLRSLYQKLGVHSRAEAIEWCGHPTPGTTTRRHLAVV